MFLIPFLILSTQVLPTSILFRGISVAVDTSSSSAETKSSLDEIQKLGANSILLKVAETQTTLTSSSVFPNPEITLSLNQIEETIAAARAHHLESILVPIILIQRPRSNKDWRGVIEPSDIRAWFNSYREMILKYARLAEKSGVSVFSIGSELVSMERYVGDWKRVIQEVRGVFHGKLIYSANWDHLQKNDAWRSLDAIGCSAYFELAKKGERPTLGQLRSRWKSIRPRLLAWSENLGRPLFLTEVGVPNRQDALSNPWDYTARGLPDPKLQADAYQAFIDVWSESPTPTGILFYEWEGRGRTKNYTPKGNPAEEVLRAWFSRRL